MIYWCTNLSYQYFHFLNRKFGFHTYALDMIQAPSIIRRYLARSYDMQNIPIGSKEVFNHMQNLPNNIRLFFAGNATKLKSKVSIGICIMFICS